MILFRVARIVASAAIIAGALQEVAGYSIASFNYPTNKQTLAKSELSYLSHVLETDGIVALTNIPEFREARRGCLEAIANCYAEGKLSKDKILTLTLPDGTKRITLASNAGSAKNDYGCAGLDSKIQRLTSIVDDASKVFASALDLSVMNEQETPLFMAVNNAQRPSYDDFSSVQTYGSHLNHFHLYEKKADSTIPNVETLEWHTDQGLFVAIVPSISFESGKPVFVEDGFEIELPAPQGSTRVTFPNNGDSVVFMLGDGMINYLNGRTVKPLRPVPHRLVMRDTNAVRIWFGRMFFPPKDAFIEKEKKAFDKVKIATTEVAKQGYVAFLGCSDKYNLLGDLTGEACKANEIYCWMACRSTAGLFCKPGESIKCVKESTGEVWTKDKEHCFDCAPKCYRKPDNEAEGDPDASRSGENKHNEDMKKKETTTVCNPTLFPTNMYMDGFNGLSDDIPCLVFLFKSLVMDTGFKYALGSTGAFLVSFLVEVIILVRREVKLSKHSRQYEWTKKLPDRSNPKVHTHMLLALYALQLVLAYMAMLLAMSFSYIIFLMVMVGFVSGHYFFNFELPAGSNEACCAASEDVQYHTMSMEVVLDKQSKNTITRGLNDPLLRTDDASCCRVANEERASIDSLSTSSPTVV